MATLTPEELERIFKEGILQSAGCTVDILDVVYTQGPDGPDNMDYNFGMTICPVGPNECLKQISYDGFIDLQTGIDDITANIVSSGTLQKFFNSDGTLAFTTLCDTLGNVLDQEECTVIECPPEMIVADYEQFCFETCTVDAFLDNQSNGEPPWGAMMWPKYNWRLTLVMSDGTNCVVEVPAIPGSPPPWRDHIESVAAALAEKTGKSWERRHAPLDGDVTTPVANHSGVTCCCTDPLPVTAFGERLEEDGSLSINPKTKQPYLPTPFLTGVWNKQITKYWLCRDCDGNEIWRDDDGNEVEKPTDCLFPCGQTPEVPGTEDGGCTTKVVEACEISPEVIFDGDEEDIPAAIVTTDIFLNFIVCGGEVQFDSAVTFPDGLSEDPVEHELTEGNFYGDCDTLQAIEDPAPTCPEGAVWNPVEVGGHYFIWDNSTYTLTDGSQ